MNFLTSIRENSTWRWAFALFAMAATSMDLPGPIRVPLVLLLSCAGLLVQLEQSYVSARRLLVVLRRKPGPDLELVASVESRQRRDALPALFWWRVLHLVISVVATFLFSSALIDAVADAQSQNLVQAGAFATLMSCVAASNTALSFWLRFDMTAGRLIALTYVLVGLFAGLLLSHPISIKSGVTISLIDAIFMAFSALTVTGLATVDIATTFSPFGMIILLVMIQTGGIGIVAITVGLAVMMRRRLSIKQVQMGVETYALPQVGSLPSFFIKVVLMTLSFELLGAGLMYLSLPQDLEMKWFHAIFHAVSAFCNAGLSTFTANVAGGESVAFQGVVCFLVISGGLGFPVAIELMTRVFNKGQKFSRLSDNALLPLVVTAGLLVVGTAAIFGANFTGRSSPLGTEIQDALFYSVSARTAGFSLSSLSTMSIGAQLVIVLLMAIGGGPVSTAGGMKTTTIGVLLCTVTSSLRGYKWVQFRRREIPSYIVQKAVTVLGLFVAAVLLAFMVLLGVERGAPWPLFFECVSALATVGLSLDVTPNLTTPGKVVIVVLMVVGRIGLATIVYAGVGKIGEQKFRMAQGRFDVG